MLLSWLNRCEKFTEKQNWAKNLSKIEVKTRSLRQRFKPRLKTAFRERDLKRLRLTR